MPASLLSDMNSQSSGLDEQRALQTVALELSTMELSKSFGKLGLSPENDNNSLSQMAAPPFDTENSDQPLKKSANMTAECVDVPTSEHVAEIVGRQGCKIKALRAKTNTYIRTPVRGEAPVFVVTGRKEDVIAAKREILSAADHFSQIRASRRNNSGGCGTGGLHGPPSPSTPGQVTIQVRVPYRVVGLVVGPKGATIKRIQQQTQTYIVTPSRDKEPIFEVTGLPDNVEKARHEIESHIALRTGGGLGDGQPGMGGMSNGMGNGGMTPRGHPPSHHMGGHMGNMEGGEGHGANDFQTNGVDAGSHELTASEMMSSMYKPPSSNSAFTSYTNALNNRSNNQLQQHQQHLHQQDSSNIFAFPSSAVTGSLNNKHLSEHLNAATGGAGGSHMSNGFSSSNGFGLYDSDEGIGSSPSFDGNPMMGLSGTSIWSDFVDLQVPPGGPMHNMVSAASLAAVRAEGLNSTSDAPCLSPTESGSLENGLEHSSVRRMCSDPLTTMGLTGMSAFTPLQQQQHHHGQAMSSTSSSKANGVQAQVNALGLSSSTSTSPTDSTGSLSGGGNQRGSHGCFVPLDSDVCPW